MANVKKSDVTTEKTGESCPSCQIGELVWRLGRYGKFKGCNRYPECNYIEKTTPAGGAANSTAQDTGVTCPSCNKGTLHKRTSRRGTIFYGCNQYPTCSYSTWDKPIVEACPSCQWPIVTVKDTKRYGSVKKCPNCQWSDNAEYGAMAAARAEKMAAWKAKKGDQPKTAPKAGSKTTKKATKPRAKRAAK